MAVNITSNPFNSSDPFAPLLNSTGINLHNYPSTASNPLLSKPIPPDVVASWPAPNYINPATKHAQMFGWELGLLGTAVIAVVLRLYARIWMVRPIWGIGGDDWGIGIGLLFAIGLTVVQLNSTRYGYGLHIWDVKPEWIAPMRKMAFCTQIFFVLSTTVTKISILYFYLRLSASPTFRLLVHGGIVFISLTGISFLFVVIFQCSPIRSYWDLTLPRARCIDESAANIANAVINSLCDLYVFSLPIKDMLGLRLPLRQRISLVVLFSLGGVVCIAGWLRVWQLSSVLTKTYDNTWHGPTLYILTAVECDLAILCGCLPALKPLMTKVIPGLRKFSTRRFSSGGLTTGSGSERRGSKGKESTLGSVSGSGGVGKRRGALSGMSLGPCPYSDPSKLQDPVELLAEQRAKLVNSMVGRTSNSDIPLYEHILKSTSRLPMQENGEVENEKQEEQSSDLERGPTGELGECNYTIDQPKK
ncbi:hypothetical protein H072_11564 [Dactylellina haptotyla CBS 200.50]|uniref:Rhodopsin domain-containing protein n=1 Tax=Dactylellina haptotyla (strain CBS 200.50) TaxID=1284197 RepID=S7ZWV9_DACHA|nr:hypothetical protein H072_11564 [Dactylellina haptotyla CBS 200.50]